MPTDRERCSTKAETYAHCRSKRCRMRTQWSIHNRDTPAPSCILFSRRFQRRRPQHTHSLPPISPHLHAAMIIDPFPHRLLTAPPHSTSCRRTGAPATRPRTSRTLYSGLPLAWTCVRHSGRRHMYSGSVITRVVIVYHLPEHHRTHPPYSATHIV